MKYPKTQNLSLNQNQIKNKTIKDIKRKNYDADKILRDIRTVFESEEIYYETIRICNAFSSNYIEYESNRDKEKTLSIEDYLDKIEPYLNDLTDDLKTQGEWEIQLTMSSNFISSKDSKETRIMHKTSDNVEIMISNETNEIIKELFDSLLQKYQKGLEEQMKGSEFIFDSVDLLYYKCHKISLDQGGLYIDSPN